MVLDPIYDNGFILLPSYLGYKLAVVRIGEVFPEVKPEMILACLQQPTEKNYTVVNVTKTEGKRKIGGAIGHVDAGFRGADS